MKMIIGIKIDDQFGPVIIVGTGGIYAELINDSVTLLLPLTKSIILKAINDLKISKLLKGYRGKPKGDIKSLVQTIMKLGTLAEKNASRLIEAGYSIEEVATVTGHKDLNVLWQVYTKITPDHLVEKDMLNKSK